jgi:hypothetical protein
MNSLVLISQVEVMNVLVLVCNVTARNGTIRVQDSVSYPRQSGYGVCDHYGSTDIVLIGNGSFLVCICISDRS